MNLFNNKKILVCGASRGIGHGLSLSLQDDGASLLLHASSEQSIDKLRTEFDNVNNSFFLKDFSSVNDIHDHLKNILLSFGKLDGLAFCVGTRYRAPLHLIKQDQLLNIFSINFFSFIEIMKVIIKYKLFNPGFSVVSISSISAHTGNSGVSVYAASKSALESATRSFAKELFKKNVRLNTIVCGQINTESYLDLLESKDNKVDPVLDRQFFGLGEISDVVSAAKFLLSEQSRFISGTIISLDGGYLL